MMSVKINMFDTEKNFFYENGYMLTSKPVRIGNMLAHYELYKMIRGVQGDVVECGVFKGSSLIQWATFRELLENEDTRKITGFDIFGEFPTDTSEKVETDVEFANDWNNKFSDEFLSKDDLSKSLEMKDFYNIDLISGDVNQTVPAWKKENKHIRIALLHVDLDVYGPTRLVLEELYENVSRGGIIVLDDYGIVEGATVAIDEFFSNKKPFFRNIGITHKPAYLIK